MQVQTIKPIQNTNNVNPSASPSPQNKLGAIDAQAVAAPTSVIAGAPTATQSQEKQEDKVDLSTKKSKQDKITLIAAFGIGILITVISSLRGRKIPK